ncbi:MAG: alpha/beta hydrolase [Hyphomicrobiaceae bacterium]|nr:alpha/beta hydrolase [Hyphomicrobiaceae bacterium]
MRTIAPSRLANLALLASLVLGLTLGAGAAAAGPLADLLKGTALDDGSDASGSASLPAGVTVQRDIAYGADPNQRYDIYLPSHFDVRRSPVIVMVHGGGWKRGDKGASNVVKNKAARWVPKGAVFVSINYRLLPGTDPLHQADDVAKAIAHVQTKALTYGADGNKVILMGHSAGAHLAALVNADPSRVTNIGGKTWLGTIALDSAALDVPAVMNRRHLPLYDAAFGANPNYWYQTSPIHGLGAKSLPLLAVCSTQRPDQPCDQAKAFAARAKGLGVTAGVREEALSHSEINDKLGLPGAYTDAVEAFMIKLDPGFAARLGKAGAATESKKPAADDDRG